MKKSTFRWLALTITAAACLQTVQAQTYVVAEAPYGAPQYSFSQQDLDAMLAPIALYPDSLLAQILMAATYPAEVADAARWSRAIPGVDPQEAVRSVAQRGWDASVQSLMAFPQILQMMDNAPDWTQRLGNAVLAQQAQVWGTVQMLRQRAYAAGQLRSNEQIRVLQNGPLLVLEPANPEVIYVPYYDPLVVYGRWWWPGYAPMRWNPWPGYAQRPGSGAGFYAGSGINVGINFFFGQVNWGQSRVTVLPHSQWNDPHSRPGQPGQEWRHDPDHRRNVPYTTPPPRPQPVPNTRPAPPRTAIPDRQPEHRPEGPPEYRGQVPGPRTQPEPRVQPESAPGASRRPADSSGQHNPGPGRADQGHAAPTVTPPAAPKPAAAPIPRAEPGRGQGGEGRGQNAAPGGAERSAAPRAPAESRAPTEIKGPSEAKTAPKESGRRSQEPEDRGLSGK